jgi:hypothetical protein
MSKPAVIDSPRCRVCCTTHAVNRQPNRATHLTIYVDGLATLTCRRHAEMAARGGGFALELGSLAPVLHAPMSTAQLTEQLRFANRARPPREPAQGGTWGAPPHG